MLKLSRYSKAVAAFAVPVAIFVADVAAQVSQATEDGFIDGTEYRLLALGVFNAIVVFLAPRNQP